MLELLTGTLALPGSRNTLQASLRMCLQDCVVCCGYCAANRAEQFLAFAAKHSLKADQYCRQARPEFAM